MENTATAELATYVVAGAFLAALLLLGLLMVLGVVLRGGRRRQGDADDHHAEELARLGYLPAGPMRWSLPVNRTSLLFHETPSGGLRWTVQLTRYNTLTLQVEERSRRDASMLGSEFSTDIPAVKERFVTRSERAAQCLALASNPAVVRCMLAMPYLSMILRGDELIIDDSERRGLQKLLGPGAPTAERRRAAEAELHRAVQALVISILDALYSRATGTLFTEHR
jgi:hypothetical protein